MHLVLVAILGGCDVIADPGSDRELVQKLVEIRQHMHTRFAATNGIRTAIAYGDIRRTNAEARIVSDLDEPEILPQWKPCIDNVRAAALQIARSEDTVTAAKQLATLGWRCAQCHDVVPGAKAVFPKSRARRPIRSRHRRWPVINGRRHACGGPHRPVDRALERGAAALPRAPLTITAEGDVPGHELGIADDVARIRLLATRAPKAKTSFDRAEIYGRLLATRSTCCSGQGR